MLQELRERDAVELAFGTTEEDDAASDPIPESQVQGRDLLNAAKDGFVYRAKGEGAVTLVKRERGLVLKVRPQFVNSPEMLQFERAWQLAPGRSRYPIKSELSEEAYKSRPVADTIYLNMRSILQVMLFLSKGVCVPEEHALSGIAPTTAGPDGRPFDWTRLAAGHFVVAAQKHRPRNAEVAVPYRGYWFYIPHNDVNSRSMLAILEILFDLQESAEKSTGPLLTLPLSG
jgi:hypothetical protein